MSTAVLAYSIESFAEQLRVASEASAELIAAKLKNRYFEDYFARVGVETMVVERPYVDHDYLNDFAAYYVKCFHPYKRHCTRLHFFASTFDQSQFFTAIRAPEGQEAEAIKQSYRGFLVVRPLPRSVVGRTALAHYDSDGGRRHFTTSVSCRANLSGLELAVSTVPFQEQDQVTAACATSALWSALNVTGQTFQHSPLSPVEITRWATDRMPMRQRVFPNADGLTIEQMAHAIRSIGLEPFYVDAADELATKAAIYAYVAGGIPGLLIFKIVGEQDGTPVEIGYHAAATTGYSIPSNQDPPIFGNTLLRSSGIDKLYVHDDQVGPHARMEFGAASGTPDWSLSTSWGLGGQYAGIRAIPQAVLFPLYNKIRLSFRRPLKDLLDLDTIFRVLSAIVPQLGNVTWDLRLTSLRDFRADAATWSLPSNEEMHGLLGRSLPRFLWHATGSIANGRVIDILFDATDIDSGKYIRLIQVHDGQLKTTLDALRTQSSRISGALNAIFGRVDSTGP